MHRPHPPAARIVRSFGPLSGVAALLTVLAAPGCAAEAESLEVEASSDELRAFKTNEVVGELAYGDTKTVVHSARPTYRALAFDVRAGDEIAIHVQAIGHDAVAWLLGEGNATLARANAVHGNGKEVLKHKATKAMRMHVAFREADYEPATFEVSLEKTNPVAAPPSPLDCTPSSTPHTGRLAVGSLGRYTYQRACDASGACSAWALTSQTSSVNFVDAHFDRPPYAVSSITTGRWISNGYVCTAFDELGYMPGYVYIGEDGRARGTITPATRCNVAGGSGGPNEVGSPRPVEITLGEHCLTIADAETSGMTSKVVYFAPVD